MSGRVWAFPATSRAWGELEVVVVYELGSGGRHFEITADLPRQVLVQLTVTRHRRSFPSTPVHID
jgi:hypothetical protein